MDGGNLVEGRSRALRTQADSSLASAGSGVMVSRFVGGGRLRLPSGVRYRMPATR